MAKTRILICPFCGETQAETTQCKSCKAGLGANDRKDRHDAMGPWFIREENKPFAPGCSYEEIVRRIDAGDINRYTIMRGPTSRQFWNIAKRIQGVAHLLGFCHKCSATVDPCDHACHACGERFGALLDRNFLGLPERQGHSTWHRPPDSDDQVDLLASQQNQSESSPTPPPHPTQHIPAPHGGSGYSADAEGRISSFINDDEFAPRDINEVTQYGTAIPADASATANPNTSGALEQTQTISATATAQPAPPSASLGATPAPIPSTTAAAYATASQRAIQRRLEAERRRNRFLVGVAVIAVAAAAVVIVMQSGGFGTDGSKETENTSSADANTEGAADTSSDTNMNAGPEQAEDLDTLPVGPDEAFDQEPPIPIADTSGLNENQKAYLEDLQKLLTAAAVASRSDDDRIADYEAAKRLLDTLIPTIENDAQFSDLLNQLLRDAARADEEIERLRLRAFFGNTPSP